MTKYEAATLAKIISKPDYAPVFEAAISIKRDGFIRSMRQAIRASDLVAAARFEGKLEGLEEVYPAIRQLAKEG